MKPQWINLYKAIGEHADHLQQFVNNVTDPKTSKNLKELASGYNKILALGEEFARLVDPIASKIVEMPFPTAEFSEEWTFYKEYLMEQYQVYIPSRTEIKMLKKLKGWAGKQSEARAIEILEFLIINRYRLFFKPSEKQLSGDEPPAVEQNNSTSMNLNIDKTARV